MKRGQAALEFLSTYGWAIVVILITIGAMSYFGIWTPQNFLPSKCTVETPFVCLDSKVDSSGEITLQLQYVYTEKLGLVEVNVTTTNCELQEDYYVSPIPVEKNKRLNASGDEYIRFSCTPATAPGTDEKFRGDIRITYSQADTGIEHVVVGSFNRRVE